MTGPLPLEEAQARLLAMVSPLNPETLAVASASGRYLAEPLVARRTQPAAALSAMDGYAVRGDDVAGPWVVVGESAAGHPFSGTLGPGQAVRIATGARVPAGADAVVVQEDCARDDARLMLTGEPPKPPSRHIRRPGSDFCYGAPLLPQGTRIGPAQMALALSSGHVELAVAPRPRVVVIDSGDELVTPGAHCAEHQIPASNGAMLASLLGDVACDVAYIGPVADDVMALAAALDQPDADVVVISGGASVGDHDLVQPALAQIGADIAFWKVAIKPGKPLLVARRGDQIIMGLPGNPVSSLVTAHFFALPLLRRLLGASACLPRVVMARLEGAIPANGPRREFRRAIWDGNVVRDGTMHDSGALASMAVCNALIDRPAHAPLAQTSAMLPIYPLGGI